jgi:hypothetical protein
LSQKWSGPTNCNYMPQYHILWKSIHLFPNCYMWVNRLMHMGKLTGAFMHLPVANMRTLETAGSHLNHLHGKIKMLPELEHNVIKSTYMRINLVTCLHTHAHTYCGGPAIAGSTPESPLLVWLWDLLLHSVELIL